MSRFSSSFVQVIIVAIVAAILSVASVRPEVELPAKECIMAEYRIASGKCICFITGDGEMAEKKKEWQAKYPDNYDEQNGPVPEIEQYYEDQMKKAGLSSVKIDGISPATECTGQKCAGANMKNTLWPCVVLSSDNSQWGDWEPDPNELTQKALPSRFVPPDSSGVDESAPCIESYRKAKTCKCFVTSINEMEEKENKWYASDPDFFKEEMKEFYDEKIKEAKSKYNLGEIIARKKGTQCTGRACAEAQMDPYKSCSEVAGADDPDTFSCTIFYQVAGRDKITDSAECNKYAGGEQSTANTKACQFCLGADLDLSAAAAKRAKTNCHCE